MVIAARTSYRGQAMLRQKEGPGEGADLERVAERVKGYKVSAARLPVERSHQHGCCRAWALGLGAVGEEGLRGRGWWYWEKAMDNIQCSLFILFIRGWPQAHSVVTMAPFLYRTGVVSRAPCLLGKCSAQ